MKEDCTPLSNTVYVLKTILESTVVQRTKCIKISDRQPQLPVETVDGLVLTMHTGFALIVTQCQHCVRVLHCPVGNKSSALNITFQYTNLHDIYKHLP